MLGTMNIERLEERSFAKLRRDLIGKEEIDLRRRFLELLQDSEKFTEYMFTEIKVEEGESLPSLNEKITKNDFQDPTRDTEREIFMRWREQIVPADACSPSLWGLATLRHIENGIIESSFLAAGNDNSPDGKDYIGRVLYEENKDDQDKMVRTALRRFSGLKDRGNRSVYTDCIFARAWWRGYLCDEVCAQKPDMDGGKVTDLFRISKTYWEKLIEFMVSKNSVLGDVEVRDTLIWVLSEHIGEKSNADFFNPSTLGKILQMIAARSALQELSVLPMDELKKVIEEFIAAVR